MAKKVLGLFPMSGPQAISSFLPVQAGYCAASEPVPDVNAPAADVDTGELPPAQVLPRQPWVVPMAVRVPSPPEAHPDPAHEVTNVAVTDPVAADDPEGSVVTQHVGVEDPATDGTAGEVNREPDVGTRIPRGGQAGQASQPATNLDDFFVSGAPWPVAVEDRLPETEAVHQHDLPPLPAITGGPSDFYAVLPLSFPPRVPPGEARF
jgi:hypothetical protein